MKSYSLQSKYGSYGKKIFQYHTLTLPKKKINDFFILQILLPQRWIRFLSYLTSSFKQNWFLAITVHYSSSLSTNFLIYYFNRNKKFRVHMEVYVHKQLKLFHTINFSDFSSFLQLVHFILVRIPKNKSFLTTFNLGRDSLILSPISFSYNVLEDILNNNNILFSSINIIDLPLLNTHVLNLGIDETIISQFLNSTDKLLFLRNHDFHL